MDFPDMPLKVQTNLDVIQQAVLNLVENAIKYAAQGKVLQVRLDAGDDICRLTTQDRRSGIPKAHQARFFETFYRVNDSLTTQQPGSGLGLSIARRMLRDLAET